MVVEGRAHARRPGWTSTIILNSSSTTKKTSPISAPCTP
jgi:hypothetical protein